MHYWSSALLIAYSIEIFAPSRHFAHKLARKMQFVRVHFELESFFYELSDWYISNNWVYAFIDCPFPYFFSIQVLFCVALNHGMVKFKIYIF